jgi:hypothetical protein
MRPVLIFFLAAASMAAQRGSVDVKGSPGWTGFVDESSIDHFLVAGSVRYYVTRKLSIEPELQYLRQDGSHHDWVFLPSLNYDFRTGRVVPYVTAGLGVIRTTEGRAIKFSNSEAFVSGGVGTKIYVNDNWFVAPEFRIGAEAHARFSVGIGHSWGR